MALNIKRSIFAAWQEYQGLGLIGGMGYASDLPRQLFILLLNNFFPDNWLRQLYFFLMLLLGPLGVYFLLNKIIIKQKFVSLMGALFYILNLATIQTFYTPFSSFVTHFAFLPWLFLTAFLYLEKPNLKSAFFFLLVNIAAIPQGYVPTVFFVYLGALILSLSISSHLQKINWKRPLKIIFATLFINAFWLLPFLFFTLTNAQVTVDSKINQMTTENYFLQNKQFGTLFDVPLLKGFWFAYTDYDKDGNLTYLLGNWRNHLMNPFVAAIGYFFFIVVISGIVYVIKSKNPFRYPLLLLFLLSFTFLASSTPPFSWIDSFLYRFPFISQALRSPFTKFSILAAFSFSIFFAFGLLWLKKLNLKLQSLIFSLLALLLIIFVLPAFGGNLFYNHLKVEIPSEYQSLQKFFKTQNPNMRIANFPQFTFWGWNFYRWGYDGSGFQWYGIEQPILDRAFDV
ncbi:MAG: hypothetical protein Q8P10_00335, partial [bacterium]|nr:hypothetical protein [bacterium]